MCTIVHQNAPPVELSCSALESYSLLFRAQMDRGSRIPIRSAQTSRRREEQRWLARLAPHSLRASATNIPSASSATCHSMCNRGDARNSHARRSPYAILGKPNPGSREDPYGEDGSGNPSDELCGGRPAPAWCAPYGYAPFGDGQSPAHPRTESRCVSVPKTVKIDQLVSTPINQRLIQSTTGRAAMGGVCAVFCR